VSRLRLKPVSTAFAGFVLGASIFTVSSALAVSNNSNTFTIRAGSSLNVMCANALTNTNVQKNSETVTCGSTPKSTTTSTTTITTTTTDPPTTTTTTVPPTTTTTTTTTTPSGANCVPVGGSFPGYATPGISQSSIYTTYVQYQDVGVTNLTGTMCDPAKSGAAWYFSGNAPNNGGAVQAFPDVQQLFTTPQNTYPPFSGFHSITSTFNATNPPDSQGNWEQAYDIWLGGYSNDIMIWVNTSDERGASSSYGGATIDGQATIGGVSYTLIHYGGDAQPERMLVLNTPENSGTVDIKAALDYLVSIGDIPSTVGVSEINFGWEICHTDGATLNYALNSYSLTAS